MKSALHEDKKFAQMDKKATVVEIAQHALFQNIL